MTDFIRKRVPTLGREVHRVGLALNYGIDDAGFRAAIDRGLQYLFYTRMRTGHLLPALRDVLARDRQRVLLATGPSTGFFGGSVRRGLEATLRRLGTEYVDVLHLFWLGVGSAWTEGTIEELVRLKEEGKARAIGVSIHDRARAGRLAKDSPLDVLMLRYNAAHPGAETDVFPSLDSSPRPPAVVAYTATSWRKLLKTPRGWTGPAMSAADCYRFCLSSPHVDLVLMGPKTRAELESNLAGIEKGALTADEARWMRDFGKTVHG